MSTIPLSAEQRAEWGKVLRAQLDASLQEARAMLARLDAKIPHDDAQARMQSPYFRIHHVLGNVLMGIEGHAVTGLPSNVLRTIDGSLLRLEVNEPLVDASMRPSVLLQQMKEQTQQFVAEHPQFADAGRQR